MKLIWLAIILVVGIIALTWHATLRAEDGAVKAEPGITVTDGVRFISRDLLIQWRAERPDVIVVDVLLPDHYGKAHIAGAINIPLPHLPAFIPALDRSKTYVVYCANTRCTASISAAKILIEAGFPHVYDFKGGIKEWQEAGLPVGGEKAAKRDAPIKP